MRVIEPPRSTSQKRHKHHKTYPKRLILGILAVLVLAALYITLTGSKNNPITSVFNNDSDTKEELQPEAPSDTLQYFADSQFKDLYEKIIHPNTQAQTTAPYVTGNDKADARLRTIAESRGYKLRRIPELAIEKTTEQGLVDDDLLQPYALEAWTKLKAAAKADGIPLTLISGYRSIAYQREFFKQKLSAANISVSAIAAGSADAQVVQVLSRVAPPGYSRHHNGYTMDFGCKNASTIFMYTTCHKWLSDDNFRRAKEVGLIPSYPEEAEQQGPEPEAWEYVWVGRQVLTQKP